MSRISESRIRILVLTIALSTLLLVSCGGSGEPGPGNGETPANATYGGIFIRDAAYGDPENLDPIVRGRMGAMSVTMNLFDGLVSLDPETASVQPAIAESWSISNDGLVYEFTLREDAYFHNGRQIVADDFVYSFHRLVDPMNASPLSYYFTGVVGVEDYIEGAAETIAGIEVVSDYSLRITREEPDSSFLSLLAFPASSVVPQEAVEELGTDFGHRPVGSGPFVFKHWVKDDRVELEAFEDYYRGRPYVDGVVFRVISEAATKEAEFLAGNLHAFIAPASIYRKYRTNPDYNLIEVAEFFTRHVGFHCEIPPFDDVRVRQAFNYAIDTETIIEVVLGGKGVPAVGYLPSSSFAFDSTATGYDYDPDRARQLLTDAGYPDGFDVPMMTNEHPEWGLPVVEAIMPYLNDVGIRLQPETMDTGVLYDRLRRGDFVTYIYSTGGSAHPVTYLWRFHSELADTTNRYSNDAVDALLEQAKRTTDDEEMVDFVRQADSIIVEDAPLWFFHYNKAITMHMDGVHGLKSVPVDMLLQDLTTVWLEPSLR